MMHIAITAAYSAHNYKHPSIITRSIVRICLILLSVSCAQRVRKLCTNTDFRDTDCLDRVDINAVIKVDLTAPKSVV